LNIRTHRRIAERLAAELGLSPRQAAHLIKGSLAPDFWKDFPHHHGKRRQIERGVLEARRRFLGGDEAGALFALGVALHYIQDAWVSLPGSHPAHDQYEREIANMPFVSFEEAMCLTSHRGGTEEITSLIDYPANLTGRQTIRIATLQSPGFGSPLLDLNFAYYVSLAVALSVCGPRQSQELQDFLLRLRDEYSAKMCEAERSLARRILELRADRPGGFARKLVRRVNLWLNERRYRRRSHLLKVQKEYCAEAEAAARDYEDWFLVEIPELDAGEVTAVLRKTRQKTPHFC